MFLSNHKIIFGVFVSLFFIANPIDVTVDSFKTLIQDLKEYKVTNKQFHAGNVYEHSMWVEQALAQFIQKKSFWCDGLDISDREKEVLALAAFLHDIGKAGDLKFSFETKKTHPEVGADYVAGKRNYILKNGTVFNFDVFFKDQGITQEERNFIALLIHASHWFGANVMAKCWQASLKQQKQLFEDYIRGLEKFLPGRIDKRVVSMAIFITAADAKGTQETKGTTSILFPYPYKIAAVRITNADLYGNFNYKRRGKKIRQDLLAYFSKACELKKNKA